MEARARILSAVLMDSMARKNLHGLERRVLVSGREYNGDKAERRGTVGESVGDLDSTEDPVLDADADQPFPMPVGRPSQFSGT